MMRFQGLPGSRSARASLETSSGMHLTFRIIAESSCLEGNGLAREYWAVEVNNTIGKVVEVPVQ